MIKSLTITNHLGDSVKLELTKPEKSGFIVKSIDGLGPVKATINTSTAGASDGSFYNSARLDSRSIVMSLKFLPIGNESIEDVRLRSYKYFPIKKKIQILVETDKRALLTEGYVEANEPNIFSSDEGCSITINCPDPLFYSPAINETKFNGVEAMFEFPFENDSLTEPLLEFGNVVNRTENVVYYEGDGEVGMTIEIHALGTVGDITLSNLGTGEKMNLNAFKTSLLGEAYPKYNRSTEYDAGDIVLYKGEAYINEDYSLKVGAQPGQNNHWVNLAGEYPEWEEGEKYLLGAKVTYNNEKWVLMNSNSAIDGKYPGEVTPENVWDRYWFNLTGVYPATILAGDTITIDTRKANKRITLLRDGVYYNILNALDRNSSWFTLSHGDNVFSYEAEVGQSNLQFKICNNIVYDGV